jgi:drug/metabolite transporter (DMT)-like permease
VFGVVAAWLILGEPITTSLAGGLVLVVAGLWLVNKRPDAS